MKNILAFILVAAVFTACYSSKSESLKRIANELDKNNKDLYEKGIQEGKRLQDSINKAKIK